MIRAYAWAIYLALGCAAAAAFVATGSGVLKLVIAVVLPLAAVASVIVALVVYAPA